MKRFLLLFSILAAALSSTHLSAQSQFEMNAEAGAKLERADRRLNAIYERLLKENASDPKFCANLRKAQRAWLKFIDLHLKTLFPLKEGENPYARYGSMFPMSYASEKTLLILQRIDQLEDLLDAVPESP